MPNKVDACAAQEHWIAHLAPVWKALKPAERGTFYTLRQLVPYAKSLGITAKDIPTVPKWGPLTLVASESDRGRLTPHKVIRFEHGAGFSFGGGMASAVDRHPSYAGGIRQNNVVMFLNPNHWANDRWELYYPDVPSYIVGSPKMDNVLTAQPRKTGKPVVALTFHWDCAVCPETRSAFKAYRFAIKDFLARDDIEIIGHCHPKARPHMRPWFEQHDVEFVQDLGQAMDRADLWMNDSSSTLYEFAATGKPVVVLNAPWFRTEVKHGLRFWEHADVGPLVWEPDGMNKGVDMAFAKADETEEYRAYVSERVFPFRGSSAEEAAKRIREFLGGFNG